MEQQIVGIADMKIAQTGLITSYGFGSCVGIVMYDPSVNLAGLLHIMLPDSESFEVVDNPLKFADTGIVRLHQQLLMRGAKRERIVCKIAGGAQVYRTKSNVPIFDVGTQNTKRVKEVLGKMQIPIIAEDLGGHCSRTIDYNVEKKLFMIKRVSQQGVQTIEL
jgi:chemotaxis protein CheD